MTKNTKSRPCKICAVDHQLSKEQPICPTCLPIVEAIEANPVILRKLQKYYETVIPETEGEPAQTELPEVLDAVRYRTTDREANTWYVSVSELEGNPVEIFASTAFDRDQHLQSRISNLTTITRLISLILRHVFMGEKLTLEKTLTQLHRSSRQPNDLPEMLGRVLSNYSKKKLLVSEQDSLP